MKYALLLIAFLSQTLILKSQDVIVLQNGEEIEVLVKEVGTTEVKYVKFNNQKGPTYAELKSNIFMIKYQNGTKDVFAANQQTTVPLGPPKTELEVETKEELAVKQGFFSLKYWMGRNRINKYEFVNALKSDPAAYALYSNYSTSKIVDRAFGAISMLGALIAVSFSIDMQNQPALIAAAGGLLAGIISQIYGNKAKSNLELAVLTYNKNLKRN